MSACRAVLGAPRQISLLLLGADQAVAEQRVVVSTTTRTLRVLGMAGSRRRPPIGGQTLHPDGGVSGGHRPGATWVMVDAWPDRTGPASREERHECFTRRTSPPPPPDPGAAAGRINLAVAAPAGSVAGRHPGGMAMPNDSFWPPAASLTPLTRAAQVSAANPAAGATMDMTC